MELLLWRHADAEQGYPDAGRPLTPRGGEQAAATARWLCARLPKHYRLIVSPAARAQQTAEALGGSRIETELRVGTGASAADLLKAAGWGSDSGTVIVVGHQPTLGQAAALILSGAPAQWQVKKSAVWWFCERSGEARLRAVFDPRLA